MFYLPAYSPEVNPDEMLNQDVETNAAVVNPLPPKVVWHEIYAVTYAAGNGNRNW